jgi:hypothetical protein
MKVGQTIFSHNERGITLVGRVSNITTTGFCIEVENGGYTQRFTLAEPPQHCHDYNEAIAWFEAKLGSE